MTRYALPVLAGRLGAVAALGLLLGACGGSGGGDDAPPTPPPAPSPSQRSCAPESLAGLQLDGARINAVDAIAAGTYQPAGARQSLPDLPAFCRIEATATPTPDSLIHFQVWIPMDDGWNGKLVTTGNGGYSPALSYNDMAHAMRQGYAVMGGDSGHQTEDMFWGVGQPEKIRDWGSRSIHAITAPGKQLIAHMKGRTPSRAYYYGCSTGGHQGFAQAQQYPQDYDGIIAGAPGNNRTALNAEFLWRFRANREPGEDLKRLLTTQSVQTITNAAVASCDTLDGVADGVINDPRLCTAAHFDIASLQCTGAETEGCLTPAQIDAARSIYQGPRNPRTGESIYPGWPVGSESGWSAYWGSTEPVRADFWRLWVFENPQWDWWQFDFDRDMRYAQAKIGPQVDQISPDLQPMRTQGRKLLVYHGWNDPVVSAFDSIQYHAQVTAHQGGQEATDAFYRLFMVPGMGHCAGGPGATHFGNAAAASPTPSPEHDLLMAMDRWVETDQAPDHLISTKVVNGQAGMTRRLCPWPKQAVLRGTDPDSADSYRCEG